VFTLLVSTTPPSAAVKEQNTKYRKVYRSTLIPASLEDRGLPPMAKSFLPNFVYFRMYQTAAYTTRR